MLARTPPPKRSRPSLSHHASALNNQADLMLLPAPFTEEEEDHLPSQDTLLCTYSCRQMVKSELLVKLDMQEKQITVLESTMSDMKHEQENAESLVKHLQSRVKLLEQEVVAANEREKAAQTHFLQETNKMEERLRTFLKRCNELEIKLQEEMQQRAALVTREAEVERQLEFLKETKANSEEAFQREINHLKQELDSSNKDFNFNISRAKAEITGEKRRVQIAEAEVLALKNQCEGLQKRLSECMDGKSDLEQKLTNARNAISPSPSRSSQDEILIRNLRDELRNYESDVAEARRLQQLHVNVDLLKEKMESERQRADRAEAALGDHIDLQLRVEVLEKELQAWNNMLSAVPAVESRDDIPRIIANLQRETMSALVEVGAVRARLKELDVALEKAESASKKAEAKCAAFQEEVSGMIANVKRLERKVILLSKERDGLKAIIASYNEEDEIAKQQMSGEAGIFSSMTEKKRGKCIEELESLVTGLNEETDMLRAEIARLESKVGRGDYDASNTKVLHMVENLDCDPVKVALQSEIHRLREKLDVLGEKQGTSGNFELLEVESQHYKELMSLREQVSSMEKLKSRYKTVFHEKITEFRQACQLLFGYQILMKEEQHASTGITTTRFTLQSIYAQTEEEKLEFQHESGHMNLLANDYTNDPEIGRMVQTLLRNMHSIPAFTANLTLDLFQKTSTC